MNTGLAVVLGSVLALAFSAAKAETRRRDVYQGRVYVSDGDTLHMGSDRLRIWGVDTPESDQVCFLNRQPIMCGEMARNELAEFIGRRSVRCEYKDWNEGQLGLYPPRAVVRCMVRGVDIGDWLISRGLAAPNYTPTYMHVGRLACEGKVGLWAGAWANPADWRRRRFNAPKGFGAQSGTSCRRAFQVIQQRMERYSRHSRAGF